MVKTTIITVGYEGLFTVLYYDILSPDSLYLEDKKGKCRSNCAVLLLCCTISTVMYIFPDHRFPTFCSELCKSPRMLILLAHVSFPFPPPNILYMCTVQSCNVDPLPFLMSVCMYEVCTVQQQSISSCRLTFPLGFPILFTVSPPRFPSRKTWISLTRFTLSPP